MKKLSANQIRKTWINFFKKHNHYEIESQSLIPKNDNSLLWINSGVATLKKYFSGLENPISNRLTNSQRCIRTNDIENVGKTARHHTFFEMLGNFSIGDYFKVDAIKLAYELLCTEFEINPNDLYITVYCEDNISYQTWIDLGIKSDHILKCSKDRNFWEIGSGPCGPCTEIYYDRGTKYDPKNIGFELLEKDIENDRYVEIWNIVFSEFNSDGNGNYTPLKRKNIDTGAGLERLTAISQDVPTDFDTDLFLPTIELLSKYTNFKYNYKAYFSNDEKQHEINQYFRIIVDHIKAALFAIYDGVIPSNKDRGYILRRLIRRAIINMKLLEIKKDCIKEIVNSICDSMSDYYPDLSIKNNIIYEKISKESKSFINTLKKVSDLFFEALKNDSIDAEWLFHLVDTYGFPIDIVNKSIRINSYDDLSKIINIDINMFNNSSSLKKIDFNHFDQLFLEHKEKSKKKEETINIEKQNSVLMNLNTNSVFDYNIFENDHAKIIKLYNLNYDEVEKLDNESGIIILDKTPFYATSGGQLHDYGTINNFEVYDVIKTPSGDHLHFVKDCCLSINEICHAKINADNRRRVTINHTCEHLLHATLKKKIDSNIKQEGAFKSGEKLTLDFQFHRKLENNEIKIIEDSINDIIKKAIDVEIIYVKSADEAKKIGAIGYFDEKYKQIKGDLRIIKIGDYSAELCGGTHVKNTGDIETFKITKYESKGSGAWRIEAMGSKILVSTYVYEIIEKSIDNINKNLSEFEKLKIRDHEFIKIITEFKYLIKNKTKDEQKIIEIEKKIKKRIDFLKSEKEKLIDKNMVADIKKIVISSSDKFWKFVNFINFKTKPIQTAITDLINEFPTLLILITNRIEENNTIQYYIATNPKNTSKDLKSIINEINEKIDGKGSGRPYFVQGGAKYNDKVVDNIFSIFKKLITN